MGGTMDDGEPDYEGEGCGRPTARVGTRLER